MAFVSLPSDKLEELIPTPLEIQEEIPFQESHARFLAQSKETVEAILNGWDRRLLLIAGPCSIHDLDSAREFATKFRNLADEVSDQFYLIMRAYFEKPRTALGWKGLLYDPDLNGSFHLSKGIRQARSFLAELTDMGVPAGSELLELTTTPYYSDFLTWGCIGARTSTSPPHRQLAASLSMPIGFKNTIDGCIDHPIHALLAASTPHVFLGVSPSGQTAKIHAEGNPFCHVVLRGGAQGPNYHPQIVEQVILKCRRARVRDRLVIDCSHDNCHKNPLDQKRVFNEVIDQVVEGNNHIVGLMLESHLYSGSQSISSPLRYGISITDPCLDWESTESLISEAAKRLQACTHQKPVLR